MDPTLIERALEQLRPSLAAGGFTLHADDISDQGRVAIVLEAGPDACAACLVPDDVLVQILESAIRAHDPSAGSVTLRKAGFEGLT